MVPTAFRPYSTIKIEGLERSSVMPRAAKTELAHKKRRRLPALPDLARQVLVVPTLFRVANCCCRDRKGKKRDEVASFHA